MAERILTRRQRLRNNVIGNKKPWLKNPDPDVTDTLENRGRDIDRYVDKAQTGRKK